MWQPPQGPRVCCQGNMILGHASGMCAREHEHSQSCSAATHWIWVWFSRPTSFFHVLEAYLRKLKGAAKGAQQDHNLWVTVQQGNGTGALPEGGVPGPWWIRREFVNHCCQEGIYFFSRSASGSWVTVLIFASRMQLEHEKHCSEATAGWVTIKIEHLRWTSHWFYTTHCSLPCFLFHFSQAIGAPGTDMSTCKNSVCQTREFTFPLKL